MEYGWNISDVVCCLMFRIVSDTLFLQDLLGDGILCFLYESLNSNRTMDVVD